MNKSKIILPILFVGSIGLFAANAIGFFNRSYGTEIVVTNVGADSTFTANITNLLTGPIPDQDRSGCHIAIRAVGCLDDSASVSVDYQGYSHFSCALSKGKVDTVMSGDFYASTASVSYLHRRAKQGSLILSIAFSYPPESWGHRYKSGAWRKK